jgi:beta-lysine 5,6-aminomutase alpha subunit
MNNVADFHDEVEFKKGGIMRRRAAQVLNESVELLEEVKRTGLFGAIEKGLFADVKRAKDGGKGADGVFEKGPLYWNPVEEYLSKRMSSPR